MEDLEFKNVLVAIDTKAKAPEDDATFLGYAEGFASTTDIDRYGDIISEKAQRRASKQLLYSGTVFYNHNYMANPIGLVVESKYSFDKKADTKGIKIRVGISKTAPDKWTLIEEGILKSFSIGGKMKNTSYEERDGEEVRIVDDMDLYEVSIVTMPANEKSTFIQFAKNYIASGDDNGDEDEDEKPTKISFNDFIKYILDHKR